jgi:hypothetical protein
MGRIPTSFLPANWRSTSPVDDGEIGIGFNLPDGSVVRLKLDLHSAEMLVASMAESIGAYKIAKVIGGDLPTNHLKYLEAYWAVTGSQSDKSSEMSSDAGSTPIEGQCV